MKKPRRRIQVEIPSTWLTVEEAAYFLRVSVPRVRQLIRKKVLTVSKQQGRVFIETHSVRTEARRRREQLKKIRHLNFDISADEARLILKRSKPTPIEQAEEVLREAQENLERWKKRAKAKALKDSQQPGGQVA